MEKPLLEGFPNPNVGLCPNPSTSGCGRHTWTTENQNHGTTEIGKDLQDYPMLLDATGRKDWMEEMRCLGLKVNKSALPNESMMSS